LFGFVEGIIVVCLLLFLITIQPFFNADSMLENSFLARLLLPIITGDVSALTEAIVLLMISGGGEGGIGV
jgi:membrane protein required for colicin V production